MMQRLTRRQFFKFSALAGTGLVLSRWSSSGLPTYSQISVYAVEPAKGEPIKIGILDPLSSPYKTSSIHDVHGATVALDMYNKRGGVLGRPVVLVDADDASNVQTALKAATKLLKEDRVDLLMGTFNGDVALAVSDLAKRENKLFMVTGSHEPELTGSRCNSHTFVFMPNANMMSRAVVPHLIKTYGTQWYRITADTADGRSAQQAMDTVFKAQGGKIVGEATTPFGTTDFTSQMTEAKAVKPNAIILNLYGWDLVNALKAYAKLELAKEKIGVGGMIGGEQIGRPLGYANNAGIWGLIWDPKINTDSSKRFIQGVIDKYNHTPTSRCYLGYAAMMQILEAIQRAGSTEAGPLINMLAGYEFDGLKEGPSYFRAEDHQCVQDVLVGQAYGKELGLGHYQLVGTTTGKQLIADDQPQKSCSL
jgi:branched-chain amino acid transport system substrate-binding protein